MKYTIEEIKKFLEPETRFHMSAHVIQSVSIEICRQLMEMFEVNDKDKVNEKTEYRKLWHDRIDEFAMGGEIDCIDIFISEALATLMLSGKLADKLKAKFDKGMGFEKVDFDAEIENEVLDICNYLIGKNYIR